jgi:hypothetical protein
MRKADVTRAEVVDVIRRVESGPTPILPSRTLESIALVKAILYVGDQLAYANDTLDAIQAALEAR